MLACMFLGHNEELKKWDNVNDEEVRFCLSEGTISGRSGYWSISNVWSMYCSGSSRIVQSTLSGVC